MSFFKNIGAMIGGVANKVEEKTRKTASINRVRTVIKAQIRASEREYLALGRYYYNNLRDTENTVTEAHCIALDEVENRLQAAQAQMETYYQEEHKNAEVTYEEITFEDIIEQEKSDNGVSVEKASVTDVESEINVNIADYVEEGLSQDDTE